MMLEHPGQRISITAPHLLTWVRALDAYPQTGLGHLGGTCTLARALSRANPPIGGYPLHTDDRSAKEAASLPRQVVGGSI